MLTLTRPFVRHRRRHPRPELNRDSAFGVVYREDPNLSGYFIRCSRPGCTHHWVIPASYEYLYELQGKGIRIRLIWSGLAPQELAEQYLEELDLLLLMERELVQLQRLGG